MTREADDRIRQRQLVGGELGRIGIVEARRRVVRRIEAVGRDIEQEDARLPARGSGLPEAVQIGAKLRRPVERQHAGAVLRLGHVLLQLGLGQIPQPVRNRGVFSA